jgi:replicative DNA helicase
MWGNMVRLEQTILKNLIYHEAYMRKVLPYLRESYFKEPIELVVYKEVCAFIEKYNNLPTHEALIINLTESKNLKEEHVRDAVELLNLLHQDRKESVDLAWLTDQTEKFVQETALHNAVMEVISIMDEKGGPEKRSTGVCPEILTKALAISFDPHIGHDYMEQSDDRFKFYHATEEKVPFDLDFFNKITYGGFSIKTLNIFLAGINVGKSLVMCHFAAAAVARGLNVLYITMEMAEEQIAKRIDANLLNVEMNSIEKLSKLEYDLKFAHLRNTAHGKLIIKEYPTAGASCQHFRALLNELALKKSFRPQLIFVDYLNIMCSSRIKMGGNVNSYTYIKSIAEELRGLAVENRVPIISATQTTRAGLDSSDLEMSDTSESVGLPATADFMAAIISNDELDAVNQYMVKVLKNRYQDKTVNRKFVIGLDRAHMRLYDVAPTAQANISQSGQTQKVEDRKPFEKVKRDFRGFKV